ncbi:MAG: hypothetical protein LBS98_02900 [Coriobacteriales bacterium]|jgi:uncharacterized protein YoxC|nr:hypothetical protein [Coriobacteriales bacterium]
MSEELLRQILIIVASILVLVFIIVGIEAIRTLRRARKTMDDLAPTLTRVNNALDTIEPALKRIDPLLERASLTVDAVNLEIMRADQILADISEVTSVTSGTVRKVAGVTDAPLNLLTSATEKVRNIFVERKAVKSSKELLEGGETEASEPVAAAESNQVPRATPAHEILASAAPVAPVADTAPVAPVAAVAAVAPVAAIAPVVEAAVTAPVTEAVVPDEELPSSVSAAAVEANLQQVALDIDNDLQVVEPKIDAIAAKVFVELPGAPVIAPSIDVVVPVVSEAVPERDVSLAASEKDASVVVPESSVAVLPISQPAPSPDDELPSLDIEELAPEVTPGANESVLAPDVNPVSTATVPIPEVSYGTAVPVPEVSYSTTVPVPEVSYETPAQVLTPVIVPEPIPEPVYIPAPPKAGAGYAPPQIQAQQARTPEIRFADTRKVEGSDALNR